MALPVIKYTKDKEYFEVTQEPHAQARKISRVSLVRGPAELKALYLQK